MSLDAALQHARHLEEVLAEALEAAAALRPLLRKLNAPGLLEWVAAREAQHARLAALERTLTGELESQARARALPPAALGAACGAQGALLEQVLGRVRE